MKLRTNILLIGCMAALWLTSQCKLDENHTLEYAAALWSGSGQALSQSSDSSEKYNPTDSDSASLPTDFGTQAVEAYLYLSGFDNVDRYKSLQIRFSQNMNKAAVEAAFSFSSGIPNTAADTGPATCGSSKVGIPCGEFHWESGRKLIFDPFVAMDSYSTFNITLREEALSTDGKKVKEYSQDFRTEHAFLMNHSIKVSGESSTTILNGVNDVTFDKHKGNLLLTTSFANPSSDNLVEKIILKKLAQSVTHTICELNCDMSATGITNLNLNSLASALRPSDGGNTYTFEIKTLPSGKVYTRSFSFNHGMLKSNPDEKLSNAATVILDEPQGLPIISSIISRFILNEYKLDFNGNKLAFEEFVNKDKITLDSSFYRSTHCISPYDDSNYPTFHHGKTGSAVCKWDPWPGHCDHSDVDNYLIGYSPVTVLRNFGDASINGSNSQGFEDGYCGASGPSGGFAAHDALTGDMDMDVHIRQMYLPAHVDYDSSKDVATYAKLTTNSDNELKIEFYSKWMRLKIWSITRVRNWMLFFMNRDKIQLDVESKLSTSGYQRAQARSKLAVDAAGNSIVTINQPFYGNTNNYPGSSNSESHNFFIKHFVDNQTTINTPKLYSSSALTNLGGLSDALVGMMAGPLVEKVLPDVTENILRNFIEVISPKILNGVIASMKDPGLIMPLPDYLPYPLANFPLNVKMQMAESTSPDSDPIVRNDGNNKGLVFNAHISISKAVDNNGWVPPAGGARGHDKEIGMLITRQESDTSHLPAEKNKVFSKVGANPGIMLQLRNDIVTQASYQLWKNRVLDLTINKEFIDTIKKFMGTGPLLELTGDLVTAEPIISIMAPGRSSITVWDESESNTAWKSKKIFADDYIDMKTDPVMAPAMQLIPISSGSGVPEMRAFLTDMQVTIQGKRCMNKGADINDKSAVIDMYAKDNADNYFNLGKCKDSAQTQMVFYTVATSRVSLNGIASFGFTGFENKTGNPEFNNLSAIHVQIANDASLNYSVDMLEGNASNPMGLDPKAVYNILEPMIKSLVVPLVNNILDQIPMPADVSFPAIVSNNTNQPCSMRMAFDSLRMSTVDSDVGDEFILGVGQLQGEYLEEPGKLISCP